MGPLSLSLQPWPAKAELLTAVSAPAPAMPPATVVRNERRLILRVGFIIHSRNVLTLWRRDLCINIMTKAQRQ